MNFFEMDSFFKAFSKATLGKEVSLLEHDITDRFGVHVRKKNINKKLINDVGFLWGDLEADFLLKFLRDNILPVERFTSWQEISASYFEKHSNVISFISPQAFRYYIPAFVVNSLNGDIDEFPNQVTSWCMRLCPINAEFGLIPHIFKLYSSLDPIQFEQLRKFIIFSHKKNIFNDIDKTYIDRGTIYFWENIDYTNYVTYDD